MRYELYKARKEKRMTQAQIAQLVGIDRASYTHIERGTRNPSMDVAQAIAKALGKTVDALFFASDVSLRNNDEQVATRETA